ncbi:MAG: PEP-CTERM sorting domain-containing protein [Verrucomicrobiota bacterium JB022]|nr:PEP-CTERM sorting domain-containing protein [Verrucomicrobiota bacterium JB022]
MYKLITTLALLGSTAATVTAVDPAIVLQPLSTTVDVGDTFTVDVFAIYDAQAELGYDAELTSFGFRVASSPLFSFDGFTYASPYEVFPGSLEADEVVGLADLDGGATTVTINLGTLQFTALGMGSGSISLIGDQFDESGLMGLFYIGIGDPSDPLDDQYLVFDANGLGSLTVVPEPTTYALLGGLAALGLASYRRKRS